MNPKMLRYYAVDFTFLSDMSAMFLSIQYMNRTIDHQVVIYSITTQA